MCVNYNLGLNYNLLIQFHLTLRIYTITSTIPQHEKYRSLVSNVLAY